MNSHGRTFPSEHAFLKLEPPEVMSPDEPDPPPKKDVEWLKYWLFRTSDLRFIPDPRLVDYLAEYKRCKRKEPIPWKSTEDLIEIFYPVRYWKENGIRFKQRVSAMPVTRTELKGIHKKLDDELVRRHSQPYTRYCPIRFSLHMELFDELIRQVAIEDPMRAFMLERVRGELGQTVAAYKQVLENSLVEENKVVVEERVDPEVVILQSKLEVANSDLATITSENESVLSDWKEIEEKFNLMMRIRKEVHEPEITLTKKLGENIDLQLYYFLNPPELDLPPDEEAKNNNQ